MLKGVSCTASKVKDEFILEGNDIELVSRSGISFNLLIIEFKLQILKLKIFQPL